MRRAVTSIVDYLAWLFKPTHLLLARDVRPGGNELLRIPGWETLRLVTGQNQLRAINAATGTDYLGGAGNEFLVMLFGTQSVFTLDHEPHRLARRIISASLTRERVAAMQPEIERAIREELDQVATTRSFDVGLLARRITIRIACLAVLGSTDPARVTAIFDALEKTTGYFANYVSYSRRLWVPGSRSPIAGLARRRVTAVRNLIDGLIEERRRHADPAGSTLDRLLAMQPVEGYDDSFIRDNLVASLAAGYDTAGSSLTWALFWLSRDDLRATLERDCAVRGNEEALDCFIAESLRYCPPLEILPRRPVGRGITAGPETMTCPCPLQVHHDPDVFDNPDDFRADRFHDRKYGPTQYFPFGAASRLCLGIQLAKILLRSTLHTVLDQGINIRFAKSHFSPVRRNVSLWPSFRMRARLTRRPASRRDRADTFAK